MNMGFVTEGNALDLLNEARRVKENQEREAKEHWTGQYKFYLGMMIIESGEDDVREFNSFELAAIIAFTMSHGFENSSEYSKLEKCIRSFIVTPFTCKVERLVAKNGTVVYIYYDKHDMKPIAESDISNMTTQVMNWMNAYVHFSSRYENLQKFAKLIEEAYESSAKA